MAAKEAELNLSYQLQIVSPAIRLTVTTHFEPEFYEVR